MSQPSPYSDKHAGRLTDLTRRAGAPARPTGDPMSHHKTTKNRTTGRQDAGQGAP